MFLSIFFFKHKTAYGMRIIDWSSDVCSSDLADYLEAIGAAEVLGRDALATSNPMESARFGGGLDNVGGPMLASLLAQTVPYGNVASAGLAASHPLPATVMPFILRGVSLQIGSAHA